MTQCSEESFVFDWEANLFELYKWEWTAKSSIFKVHAQDITKWYCEFNGLNLFSLIRAGEEDENEPGEIEVKWEATILKSGRKCASSGVRSYSFEKGGLDEAKFDLEVNRFVNHNGVLRLRCCLWVQPLQTSEPPKDAVPSIPHAFPGDTDLPVDCIPSEAVTAKFPRYDCGALTNKMERIVFGLNRSSLSTLRTKGELSTFVTCASGMNPPFYIRCSMVDTSELLKIEIRRIGEASFTIHVDISLVNADDVTIKRMKKSYKFTKEVNTLACKDFVRETDLTPAQNETSPRSLQFKLKFRPDRNYLLMENSTFTSQRTLKHPKTEIISAVYRTDQESSSNVYGPDISRHVAKSQSSDTQTQRSETKSRPYCGF